MTDAALRKAAQKYVDAREALAMVNKRIHPQTWANLDEDADKALNDLRAALSAPEPAGPTQEQVEVWAQKSGFMPCGLCGIKVIATTQEGVQRLATTAYAAGRASKEGS